VIVVIHQRRDPRHKPVEARVVFVAAPEHRLCFFGPERWVAVAAPRGDEVHLVVDVPVFEAVLTLVELPVRVGDLAERAVVAHGARLYLAGPRVPH
jgi:hypothetical protein